MCAGVLAALFCHYPTHRAALMSDFLTHAVSQLGASGRASPRHCVVGGAAGQEQASVMVATAAIVRMVQVSERAGHLHQVLHAGFGAE